MCQTMLLNKVILHAHPFWPSEARCESAAVLQYILPIYVPSFSPVQWQEVFQSHAASINPPIPPYCFPTQQGKRFVLEQAQISSRIGYGKVKTCPKDIPIIYIYEATPITEGEQARQQAHVQETKIATKN
jgi:hypothetical protein